MRGTLALRAMRAAINQVDEIAIVDGGSSEAFVQASKEVGIQLIPQDQANFPKMSGGRQQGYRALYDRGVGIIVRAEIEKCTFFELGCLPDCIRPIVDGELEIVVPQRNHEGFKSLPGYQAEVENKSNRLLHERLCRWGLWKDPHTVLDQWFGPKIFVRAAYRLFRQRYIAAPGSTLRPHLYSNALFYPVYRAMMPGFKAGQVTVPYRHPWEQTKLESADRNYDTKRDDQQRWILDDADAFASYWSLNGKRREDSQLTLEE